jgi:hypothetical protein
MQDVSALCSSARENGMRIVSVGAAAKGLTFLKAAGIKVDAIVDEAEDKIGKWVDDLDVQIEPLTSLEYSPPALFLVSAWNFVEELESKIVRVLGSPQAKYKLCVYFPSIEVRELRTDFNFS